MMAEIIAGDCAEVLPTLKPASVQCCVTSPPYWGLRDYGATPQLGLETTPDQYVANMVEIFRRVRRVLRNDGTLWLNLGDSYTASGSGAAHETWTGNLSQDQSALPRSSHRERRKNLNGLKPKDLCGIPWRVAFALQADGWYLRSDIIWHKPNPMPESVIDRPTKSHEYIFLLSKSERYFYDADAIREPSEYPEDNRKSRSNGDNKCFQSSLFARINPGSATYAMRNKRTVWTIATQPYAEAHFATFPEELPKLCILAGSRLGDIVLDPFAGSGTTGRVAIELGRRAILIELNPAYIELARDRTNITPGFL